MSKKQIGATLPLVVFALTALLGMAALAIDMAMMTLARQRAQNVADAAALAGAANMATASQASTAANQVVSANNAGGSAFGGTTVTLGAGNAVTVQGYVNAPLSFAPAVGYAPQSTDGKMNTLSVSATATATVQNVCSLPPGSPIAPFRVIGDDPANKDQAVAYVSALLTSAKTVTPGVYQPTSAQVVLSMNLWTNPSKLSVAGSFIPILTSGSGAPYFNTISQTSDQTLASGQTLPNAPLNYDNVMFTRQYLAARLSGSNTSYSHAYATYDAWFNAGSQEIPGGGSLPEDHLLIVPVVSQSAKNMLAPVTVIAFATFFVDQPYPSGLTGNGVALGRFIGLTITNGSGGGCSGVGSVSLPHLTH